MGTENPGEMALARLGLWSLLCLGLCGGTPAVTLVLTASAEDRMGMPRLPLLLSSLAKFCSNASVHSLLVIVPDAEKAQFTETLLTNRTSDLQRRYFTSPAHRRLGVPD